MRATVLLLVAAAGLPGAQPFFDRTHKSSVFGEERNYRIFLPPDYEDSGKRYPVIYYFHGHSDRYTLESYDEGKGTVPSIVRFVAGHDAIVVAVDGYVAEHYTGFYGGEPWDVRKEGGDHDFGPYFREFVDFIDGTYRTLTDRRHRGTSGLSMGGFMSLYLSARYPELVGSASAFNPAPDMFTGDKGRRTSWCSAERVAGHTNTMIRLVRASGDYISQYHEETRMAYARAHEVDFEYRQDEWHRHAATSIGETFEFHMRAFDRSELDNVPVVFHYSSAYRSFEVRGYEVKAEGAVAGLTHLTGVRQGGLRVTTRRWEPDGPPIGDRRISVTTAPLYKSGAEYRLLDRSFATGETAKSVLRADSEGRLSFTVDGSGRQISFAGPGAGAQPPVLLPVTAGDQPRFPSNVDLALPVRIYNPRGEAMTEVKVSISSEYPTVEILASEAVIPEIGPGGSVDVSDQLRFKVTGGGGYFAPARISLRLGYDGWYQTSEDMDFLIVPEGIPAPAGIEVLDGRTHTFSVFRQHGNNGGGQSIERTVTEGSGNGNGKLESGEEATIWVKHAQGMDPFDKNNWCRAKVYADSGRVTEADEIRETRQREWMGATNRSSVIRLAADGGAGEEIPVLLDTESWTFHFTPDVRYGREKLLQGYQLHQHHLHRWTLGRR
jgi:predicted alpha/beta superfamily hydrolase